MILTNAHSTKTSIPYRDDIFEIVREIPLIEVLERYSPNPLILKHGKPKMICPFHDDKNPSVSVKGQRWKCFGCGAGGDSIDLVARLYGLTSLEAAQMIAENFGLVVKRDKPLMPEQLKEIQRRNERRKLQGLWAQGADKLFRMACEMREAILTVTTPGDAEGETMETLAQLENLIDVLMYGNPTDIMHVLNGGWYHGYSG